MAPQPVFSIRVCILAAVAVGLAEAAMRSDEALTHSSRKHSTVGASLASGQLAYGSTARNVAAAQYAAVANSGREWWPGIATWQRWHTTAEDTASNRSHRLDKMVDTALLASVVNATTLGLTESLDEAGYITVAAARSDAAMLTFMHRAAAKEGFKIVDESEALDVVKFYSGECARQTYRNLLLELRRAERQYLCHRAWTARVARTSAAEGAAVAALMAVDGYVATGGGSHPGHTEAGVASLGSTADLSQIGYQEVARTKDTAEMMLFIERALKTMNMRVLDEEGLKHFAPYFSGECATQSFARLLKELLRASSRPQACGGGWVAEV